MPDAAVVGAGPAGLSAALGLLRSGFRVSIYERNKDWKERVCGAFLDAEAIAHLRWLGLDNAVERQAVPVPRIRVTTPAHSAGFSAAQSNLGPIAVPRKQLEAALTSAVARVGGELLSGRSVKRFQAGSGGWQMTTSDPSGDPRESEVHADWLVLADGRFSLGKRTLKSKDGWYGWRALFAGVRQNPGDMSLHFFPSGYVGVLTFANGESNVCGLSLFHETNRPAWPEHFSRVAEQQPAFRAVMSGAERIAPWTGVGPIPFAALEPERDVIACGDAAAVGDPFMGEGNGRALGAGPLLHASAASSRGDYRAAASAYWSEWQKAYRARFRLGHWLRPLLERSGPLHPLAGVLLGHPAMLRPVLPLLHKGYRPRTDGKTEPEAVRF